MFVNGRIRVFKMFFDSVVQMSYGAANVKIIAFGA